ncbi:RES family NAD+ phosphorylase [Microbacterium album]|uniref:RES domain-containing protein n=1 Tax=Microbacterium album TaxID=2053191 RepID=A0A917MM00_9MICO|nr:RES family NAD+ phosphorylase [Microbacterium album]GGH44040.1 hypothetical protein GCM10010921_18420 [Microbacterium album]
MTAKQPLPDPATDYTGFPAHTVLAGEEMYRAHTSGKGAWWFDNGTAGRFNLHGRHGTCCTATSVDTAVREKVRDEVFATGVVSRAFANSFAVSTVSAPRDHRCAAVSSTAAAGYLVVRELVTMADYSVPRAWAETLHRAGFDGVFYGSAYTTGDASAYALFGDAGEPTTAGFTEALSLTGPDACTSIGMKVEGPPPAHALTVIS